MKINFAAGRQTWDGFYCVDAVQHLKATRQLDLIHALKFDDKGALLNPLPLDRMCASEIHCYHFIEHVYRWEAASVLREFARLLEPRGRLILELPDIEKAARNLLKNRDDKWCMWPLYGDPGTKDPYMCHKWGYTPKTIGQLLSSLGFKDVQHKPPQSHGKKKDRDMRIECHA